jgi:ABC-type transporter Mla MlaB component
MSTPAQPTITFAVRGPIERADLPGLCERVCALLSGQRGCIAYCDVSGVRADAGTIDALARLQLGASRNGCQVRLRSASPDLLDLVAFLGLTDVLPE